MEKALLSEETPPREVLCGRFRFRTPLRCDGIGKLDCVEDLHSGLRKVVRWLPLEVNRYEEQNIVHFCAKLPTHSSLPGVCEVGEMESWAYMVVDFPEGDLLSARKAFLEPGAWRHMACQLAEALSALHAAQVCHGELCMPSVMLLEAERPLLWDMPLVVCSRMADRRQAERLLQQLVRIVSTMAPERARGGPLTQEGDVYSLGVVLAYSAGSEQPWGHPTLALVHEIASGNFKPDIPHMLAPAYRNMLVHMLAPYATDRPRMCEVAAFFAAPPNAPPPGIPPPDIPLPDVPPPDIPLPGVPSPAGLPLFPAPRLPDKAAPPPPAVLSTPPPLPVALPKSPPSTPTVSGVDWIQMLSPQEKEKKKDQGV